MVRLKDKSITEPMLNMLNFNSIMVRLKDKYYIGVGIAVILFQFHNGTIKS